MNKLYGANGRLIGYNSRNMNTHNRTELFKQECEILYNKLNLLGIPECDHMQYFAELVNKYLPSELRVDNDGIIYMTSCFRAWTYKPCTCIGLFQVLDSSISIDCPMNIDMSIVDTSNSTEFINMFDSCIVKSLDLSNMNTSKAVGMNRMFYNCQVSKLDLSSFDTSNVKTMHSMFCESKVHELNLSSFDTSEVIDMRSMFYNAKIDFIDMSRFNMKNAKYMQSMFSRIWTTCITINKEAFYAIYNNASAFDHNEEYKMKFAKSCKIIDNSRHVK